MPQPRPRAFNVGGSARIVSNADPRTKAWKKDIYLHAAKHVELLARSHLPFGLTPSPARYDERTPLALALYFFLEPAPSLLRSDGTLRASTRMLPVGSRDGDCDNLAKPVLDELQGLLFNNDSQVVSLEVRKWWVTSVYNPQHEDLWPVPEGSGCLIRYRPYTPEPDPTP
jgi:hypothetical protein